MQSKKEEFIIWKKLKFSGIIVNQSLSEQRKEGLPCKNSHGH
jgi:hypothetical protein